MTYIRIFSDDMLEDILFLVYNGYDLLTEERKQIWMYMNYY